MALATVTFHIEDEHERNVSDVTIYAEPVFPDLDEVKQGEIGFTDHGVMVSRPEIVKTDTEGDASLKLTPYSETNNILYDIIIRYPEKYPSIVRVRVLEGIQTFASLVNDDVVGGSIDVLDEGVVVLEDVAEMNFLGTGVQAELDPNDPTRVDVTVTTGEGPGGVDQTARDSAAAAQTTADGAVTDNIAQQTELDAINPFTAADETKLDGIEASADVNVGEEYTQTEKTKLAGVESGAEANVGQQYTNAEKTKLGNIESNATADQTGSEIVDAIDTQLGGETWQEAGGTGGVDQTARNAAAAAQTTADGAVADNITQQTELDAVNPFTAADETKLDGIEIGAEVNVGVTSDGTLAGSGVTGSSLRVTNPFTNADESKLDGIEAGADANVGQEYTQTEKTKLASVEAGADVNVGQEYTQTEKTKLGGIEIGAEVNVGVTSDGTLAGSGVTGSSLRVANPFTNADESKLDGIEAGADVNVGNEFTNADETKLDNIESNATADQSGTEIVDAIDTQLGGAGWQAGGTGAVDQTARNSAAAAQTTADGAVTVNATQQTELDAVNPFTAADETKLDGIEDSATADQTGGEIVSAIDTQLGSADWQEAGGEAGSFTSDVILDTATLSDSVVTEYTLTEDIETGYLIEFIVKTVGAEGTLSITADHWLNEHTGEAALPTNILNAEGLRLSSSATGLENRAARTCYFWRGITPDIIYAKSVEIGGSLISLSVRKSSLGGPRGPQGIPGTVTDQTARDSAAAAQTTADDAVGDAAAAQTTADGAVGVNVAQQTELDAINPFTNADETKLDGIAAGADVNVGVEYTLVDNLKLNSIEEGADVNVGQEYTQIEKTKLAGVETGAEANVGNQSFHC